MTTVAAIFAHQGGWDEALLIAGPLLVIAGLLWLAKRRVDRAADGAASPPGESFPPDDFPADAPPGSRPGSRPGDPDTTTESRPTGELD